MKKLLLSLLLLAGASGASTALAQTWTGVAPATAANASGDEGTVYLWNVATKTFLEKGGRWGTEAVQGSASNGQAFTVEKSGSAYKLKANFTAADGGSGYLTFMGATTGSVNGHDKLNYYVDQNASSYITFTFTSTDGGYTISNNSYYLCAAYNSSSSSTYTSIAINGFLSSAATNNVWQLVTLKERKEYFQTSTESGQADAGATFLMKDYDFARKDGSISNWKIAGGSDMVNGSYSDGKAVHTPSDYAGTTTTTTTYTYSIKCNYRSVWSSSSHTFPYTSSTKLTEGTRTSNFITGSSCSSEHNRYNPSSQEVTLTDTKTETTTEGGYTYYVGNGIDNDDSNQLNNGGKWAANIHGASGKLYQTITVPMAGQYRIKCKGLTSKAGCATLYATSNDVTATTAFSTHSLDVTTATYLDPYTALQADNASAAVTVNVADGNLSITFGVEVADGDADTWTFFDDFELEFIGVGNIYVILDETKQSVDYLNKQNENDKVKQYKSTVYLHRSFTAGVWNTIVLPFDLNAGAITAAFGAGTKVSKFVGATDADKPTSLFFEPVTEMEKDHLYLIIPGNSEPTVNVKVTATADESIMLEEKYYTLDGVSFAREESYPEDGLVGGQDSGNETYTGDTQLEFKGIYMQKQGCIPAHSYLIKAGTEDVEGSTGVWYYRTVTSSSRGFRGWLQPKSTGATKVESIVVNGVEIPTEDVTGIEGLTIVEAPVNGNIYTISGQLVRANATSTEGLAKGIYVVNGKKVVVK